MNQLYDQKSVNYEKIQQISFDTSNLEDLNEIAMKRRLRKSMKYGVEQSNSDIQKEIDDYEKNKQNLKNLDEKKLEENTDEKKKSLSSKLSNFKNFKKKESSNE
jgi:16S rRNA U1498 N3-methylase RsmE